MCLKYVKLRELLAQGHIYVEFRILAQGHIYAEFTILAQGHIYVEFTILAQGHIYVESVSYTHLTLPTRRTV